MLPFFYIASLSGEVIKVRIVKEENLWHCATVVEYLGGHRAWRKIQVKWHSTKLKQMIVLAEFEEAGSILRQSDKKYVWVPIPP